MSVPCPEIATFYQASGPKLANQWLARYVAGSKSLPMVFVGLTEDVVRAAASQWWVDEQNKLGAKNDRLVAAREARKSGRAA